jgi:hypothetical protein
MSIACLHRTPRLGLVALLAGALVLVGCSDSDDPSSDTASTTTSGPAATPPGCPPVSEVDAVLKAGLGGPDDRVQGDTRTCTYEGPPGGDDVVITYTTGVTTAAFDAAAQAPGPDGAVPSAVTGVGDAAYATTSGEAGNETTTLTVLSGTTEVAVRAPVPAAQVEELARKLVSTP